MSNLIKYGRTGPQDYMIMIEYKIGVSSTRWQTYVHNATVLFMESPIVGWVVQMPMGERYKIVALGHEWKRDKQVPAVYLKEFE